MRECPAQIPADVRVVVTLEDTTITGEGFATVGGILGIIAFIVLVGLLRALIRVCPSNHILVVTGGTKTNVNGKQYGFRIQKSRWTTIIPFIQSIQSIDLSTIPISVQVDNMNSANGITVGADATACICINNTLLYSAVQQLLGKSHTQIQEQIQQTIDWQLSYCAQQNHANNSVQFINKQE
ncbi:MAG: SPFH domain-containing protein [Candidatus Poribacteria bacterium]